VLLKLSIIITKILNNEHETIEITVTTLCHNYSDAKCQIDFILM